MVSCGRDNIRLWRLKDGTLRSAPVSLGEYHSVEFTDICFESGYHASKKPEDKLMYVCQFLNVVHFLICLLKVAFFMNLFVIMTIKFCFVVKLILYFPRYFFELWWLWMKRFMAMFCLFSYACSRSGHMFEIDYQKVAVRHVRRLLPIYAKEKNKDSIRSGQFITIPGWLLSLVSLTHSVLTVFPLCFWWRLGVCVRQGKK